MTARPSIVRLVVISPTAVVVLLIGLWAILGTWQDEAAARAAASERTSHDRSGREDARNVVSIARGTGSEFTWNDRGHLVTNYDVVAYGSGAQVRLSDEHDAQSSLVGVSTLVDL